MTAPSTYSASTSSASSAASTKISPCSVRCKKSAAPKPRSRRSSLPCNSLRNQPLNPQLAPFVHRLRLPRHHPRRQSKTTPPTWPPDPRLASSRPSPGTLTQPGTLQLRLVRYAFCNGDELPTLANLVPARLRGVRPRRHHHQSCFRPRNRPPLQRPLHLLSSKRCRCVPPHHVE